jgi:hypothetical protein
MRCGARLGGVAGLGAICGLACASPPVLGSGATGTGGTSGSLACTATTPSPPAPTGDTVRDTAQANEFAFVDGVVGVYLRGPVYAGPASASDDSGGYGSGPGAFATTNAIAAVVSYRYAAVLTIASPADHARLLLGQQPGSPEITEGLGILVDGTYMGGYSSGATCTSCTPDFLSTPSSFVWSDLDMHSPGAYFSDGSVEEAPYDIISTVDLQRATPCVLTWDQIVTLNGGPGDFVQEGNEMVQHSGGSVQTVEPSPAMCDGLAYGYTIDRYINLSNLFDYGVRNYVAGSPISLCGG